jgi:hypothetical protein
MLKTKGAIAVSLRIFGTSFLFINSHFPAHESQLKRRIEEYENIISLNLPRDLSMLKTRYITSDMTGRFDIVFWFGDLNFRIDLPYDDVMKMFSETKLEPELINNLLKNDQLTNSMNNGIAFRSFSEGNISFLPTYKFCSENTYDSQLKRTPSFTDRILFRSKRLGHIVNHQYNSVPQFNTSDHKPVFALFEAQLRHGRDDIPLNAGAFNREVLSSVNLLNQNSKFVLITSN